MKTVGILSALLMIISAGCCCMDAGKKTFTDPNDFTGSDIEKIQAAVYAAQNHGGKVRISARRADENSSRDFWLIDSAILLPSDTTLLLDNCRIKLSDLCRDNMIRSANCGMGIKDVKAASNIRIYGIGRVILEGAGDPRATGDSGKTLYSGKYIHWHSYGTDAGKAGESQKGDWRNIGILLVNVKNFAIENLTISDSHCWAVSLEYCSYGSVKNLHFESRGFKMINGRKQIILNQDGLDLRRGCSHIVIDGITGFTGDDLIALTAINGKVRESGKAGFTEMCGGRADMQENHTHDITISNVAGYCAGGHHIVRFLNASGIRIYNVVLSNLLDTSPAGFSCFAALKIGDSNPRWGGVTPLGDTFNIKVHNLVSRAQSGIMIAGSLTGSEISGVTNLNPAARAVDYRSGRENVQNVSFENIIDFR